MDTFIQEICGRKLELKKGDFAKVKTEIFKTFGFMLPGDYKHKQRHLSDFNVAFLDLYKEKASMLRESYVSILQDNLTEFYKHTEEEHLRSLTVEDDLSIYSINFPENENQSEWEVNFEMDLDATKFHIYFEGWKFKTIGQTH